jgi:hypothetical protein
MLKHAVGLAAGGHLALVLTELVERAWPAWHVKFPDDWRPALAVAALRACVLDKGSGPAVVEAYFEVTKARKEVTPLGRRDLKASFHIVSALCAALEAVHPKHSQEDREFWARLSCSFAASAVSAARKPADSDEDEEAGPVEALAAFADLFRKWMPYPDRRTDVLDVADTYAVTSGAVLLLNGWNLVEAIPGNPSGQLTLSLHQGALVRGGQRPRG